MEKQILIIDNHVDFYEPGGYNIVEAMLPIYDQLKKMGCGVSGMKLFASKAIEVIDKRHSEGA